MPNLFRHPGRNCLAGGGPDAETSSERRFRIAPPAMSARQPLPTAPTRSNPADDQEKGLILHKLTISAGLLLLGLSACGSEPASNENAPNSALPANISATAPATGSAPATAAAAVVLEGSGLRLPGASPPRSLAFDTAEAEAIDALTKALGRPPTERGENEECGGGSMKFAEWKDELTAWFLDERFAGWDSKGKLKTLEGIGIGSPRADLATLPGFEVEESTLGTEFRSGGLSGVFDSKAPAAKVSHLWGGATCVFR